VKRMARDTNPLAQYQSSCSIPILLQLVELAASRSGIDKRRKLISNTRFKTPESRVQIQTILESGILNLES
jgi:hypothetical protein